MPTSSAATNVHRAPIQFNLTAAGWAVLVMMVAAVFMSSSSRLAVGFLIPLAAALAIDIYLSWHVITRRSISIVPAKTVVHTPDGLPLRVTMDGPPHPVRVTVTFKGGVDQVVAMSNEAENIKLPAKNTGAVDYLRCDLYASVFGLGLARRWETHVLPTLHWAPAPSPTRLTTPTAVDEVARLRTYVPGDRMSRVSWPITARTGQMHVRAAGDGYEEFTVVLNLGPTNGDPGEGALYANPDGEPGPGPIEVLEHIVQLASTLMSQLLEDGHQVRLVTTELAPEVRESLREAAKANPRLPAAIPPDVAMETQVVDRYVSDEDDLARRLALAEVAPAIAWGYGAYVEVSVRGVRSLP